MKPYPLAPLNHFTTPFSLTNYSFRLSSVEVLLDGCQCSGPRRRDSALPLPAKKKRLRVNGTCSGNRAASLPKTLQP